MSESDLIGIVDRHENEEDKIEDLIGEQIDDLNELEDLDEEELMDACFDLVDNSEADGDQGSREHSSLLAKLRLSDPVSLERSSGIRLSDLN